VEAGGGAAGWQTRRGRTRVARSKEDAAVCTLLAHTALCSNWWWVRYERGGARGTDAFSLDL
jgi:hypothetical protein